MNWFLDMCILIYYSSEDKSLFAIKTAEFISKHDKEKYLVCYYITKENLPKWIRRQKIIVKEVIRKTKDIDYIIGSSEESSLLYPKDKQKVEKLISLYKLATDKTLFVSKIQESQKTQELKILQFIEAYAKKVIPIPEIDFELKSSLFTFLNNDSDSKTLASGIQQHNKEEVVILTADKIHWTKENIGWAFDSKPPLAKKYPKIPEIKYIQDFNTNHNHHQKI